MFLKDCFQNLLRNQSWDQNQQYSWRRNLHRLTLDMHLLRIWILWEAVLCPNNHESSLRCSRILNAQWLWNNCLSLQEQNEYPGFWKEINFQLQQGNELRNNKWCKSQSSIRLCSWNLSSDMIIIRIGLWKVTLN